MYTKKLHVAHSARKHGVTDEDMHHAARNFVVELYDHDGSGALLHLLVGPAPNGSLLELVIVDPLEPDDATIIHAMSARKGFATRAQKR